MSGQIMFIWPPFECPNCHEPFRYEPTSKTTTFIEEMELKTGRVCTVVVNCPHCPAAMIGLNRKTGRAQVVKVDSKETPEGIVYDMTLTEKAKEEVGRLNEEGHALRKVNTARAEATFRQALVLRKHDPLSWYNVGVCRHAAGDLRGAEECFRHALQFDPKNIQAWNNLGSVLAETGRLKEADEAFIQGIAVEPKYPKFYLGRANVAVLSGDIDTAKRHLKQALEFDSSYEPARTGLRRLEEIHSSRWPWKKRK